MQPCQNTTRIFHRARTNNPKICVEPQKTPNNQGNLETEKQSFRHHSSRLQVILQRCSDQESMVLSQKQTHRLMEQNRKPRNEPTTTRSTNLQESRKEYLMGKVSSTNGVGKTG